LGAVAYVPTIDRRRASFVEGAAEAGGLDPADGVLTPEMARCVLRDKLLREEKLKRAEGFWEDVMASASSGDMIRRGARLVSFLTHQPRTRELEQFRGFVERIDGDRAYVTLVNDRGDQLGGPYPLAELAAKGIGERDRFILTTFDLGDVAG